MGQDEMGKEYSANKKPEDPPRKGTYWHRLKGGPRAGEWVERPLSFKKS